MVWLIDCYREVAKSSSDTLGNSSASFSWVSLIVVPLLLGLLDSSAVKQSKQITAEKVSTYGPSLNICWS